MITALVGSMAIGLMTPVGAPQADPAAADAAAIFRQVHQYWHLRCDDPAFASQRVRFLVVLNEQGRILGKPEIVDPVDDSGFIAVAESARIALLRASPFTVKSDFQGGRFTPVFDAAAACRSVQR